MKKMMFLSKNWYFSVQKALIYYTVNKSHHNSFILLVFSHVANFKYVANFRFLTLVIVKVHTEHKNTQQGINCVHVQSGNHSHLIVLRPVGTSVQGR